MKQLEPDAAQLDLHESDWCVGDLIEPDDLAALEAAIEKRLRQQIIEALIAFGTDLSFDINFEEPDCIRASMSLELIRRDGGAPYTIESTESLEELILRAVGGPQGADSKLPPSAVEMRYVRHVENIAQKLRKAVGGSRAN